MPKIPQKPKSAARERAQMASMGLPTQFKGSGAGKDSKKKAAVVASF
jgi:hypothetical protein